MDSCPSCACCLSIHLPTGIQPLCSHKLRHLLSSCCYLQTVSLLFGVGDGHWSVSLLQPLFPLIFRRR
jgi:hypothetical protein